jgi:hypothetical protein
MERRMPKFDAKARTRLAGLSERERAAAVGPLLKKLKSDGDDPSDDVLATSRRATSPRRGIISERWRSPTTS